MWNVIPFFARCQMHGKTRGLPSNHNTANVMNSRRPSGGGTSQTLKSSIPSSQMHSSHGNVGLESADPPSLLRPPNPVIINTLTSRHRSPLRNPPRAQSTTPPMSSSPTNRDLAPSLIPIPRQLPLGSLPDFHNSLHSPARSVLAHPTHFSLVPRPVPDPIATIAKILPWQGS